MITDAILEEINRRRNLPGRMIWAVIGGFVAMILFSMIHPVVGAIWMILGYPAAIIYFWRDDKKRRTTTVTYQSETSSNPVFQNLSSSFSKIARSQAVRVTTSRTDLTALADRKKNAGATRLVGRQSVKAGMGMPKYIACNIQVPAFASNPKVFFYPDCVLVDRGKKYERFTYNQINASNTWERFIEDGSYPKDAPIVDQTWRYVNKNGTPDKRMKDNRQLPVLLYEVLDLSLPNGETLRYQISAKDSVSDFVVSLLAMQKVKIVAPSSVSPLVTGEEKP